MITVTVNGESNQFDDKKYPTFKDFYDENKLEGKVLSRLVINEKEVPVSKLDDIFSATFEGGETVEMTFEELIPFTLDLLSNLMEYFEKFENALPAFAKNISFAKAGRAFSNFSKYSIKLDNRSSVKEYFEKF